VEEEYRVERKWRKRTDDGGRGISYLVRSDVYQKLLLLLRLLDFETTSFGVSDSILPSLDPIGSHLLLSSFVILPVRYICRDRQASSGSGRMKGRGVSSKQRRGRDPRSSSSWVRRVEITHRSWFQRNR